MAPPLAGMSGMPVARFLAFDVPGAVIWSGSFLAIGYLFSNQLDRVYQKIADLGSQSLALLASALVMYIAWRFIRRHLYIRKLRTLRIEPDALVELLAEDPQVSIFDLRSAIEIEMDPRQIRGAKVMSLEELHQRHDEIPRDREIVLYCS